MKRTYALIALAFMLVAGSCGRSSGSSNEASPTGNTTQKINGKAAEGLMEHYMFYVVNMDSDAKRSFYSTRLQQEVGGQEEQQEPHPVGYILGEGEGSQTGSNFSAKLLYEVAGEPSFSIDTYSYELVNENGSIKIDKISKESSMELIGQGDKVFVKKDEESEKQKAVSLDDLPDYTVMQTGASPEQKFSVPKDKFTSCGMASDGENIIVTSSDNNGSGCFIAKVTIEEKETMQQGKEGEDKKQGGGQQKEGEEQQPQDKEKSTSTVKPIDLISGCQAYGISFSPKFDKFIVGLSNSDGTRSFRVYDMESGKIVDTEVPFIGGDTSSSLPYFSSENKIVFTVTASEKATDEERSYEGRWSLDLKEGELKQIE